MALLNREDVARLGSSLKKVYKVEDTAKFADLIRALDALDRADGAQGGN